jgi:hypothetical protein
MMKMAENEAIRCQVIALRGSHGNNVRGFQEIELKITGRAVIFVG